MDWCARAREVGGNQACREFGYHRSSYCRLRHRVLRQGLEMLSPRERRPRIPDQVPHWLGEPLVAFAFGHPGLGPAGSRPNCASRCGAAS